MKVVPALKKLAPPSKKITEIFLFMNSYLVVGLGYGDEGKGLWVDHLVRKHGIKYVVRFNGGTQASHHVVRDDGYVHGFSQFASASFDPEVNTCLSRFMLIDPQYLLSEAEELLTHGVQNPLGRMLVSENAPVITPFNRLLNRMQEIARAGSKHGSCGFGIGITQGDVENLGRRALYVRDLRDYSMHKKLLKLWDLRMSEARACLTPENQKVFEMLEHVDLDYYMQLYTYFFQRVKVLSEDEFRRIIRENEAVFEGAQGVLLDQGYGFFPHCTRSNCTFENAELLLKEAGYSGAIHRIGLLRGYGTRHGAGPFVTEDTSLKLTPCNNQTNAWQGQFRLGWFDAVAARYALDVVGKVDQLAITNLDRMRPLATIKVATRYDNADTRFFTGERIKLLKFDKELFSARTRALAKVQARYQEFPGFGNKPPMEYLNQLSQLINCPIKAYSIGQAHKHQLYL